MCCPLKITQDTAINVQIVPNGRQYFVWPPVFSALTLLGLEFTRASQVYLGLIRPQDMVPVIHPSLVCLSSANCLDCFTSCSLTTLHCSKVSWLKCCPWKDVIRYLQKYEGYTHFREILHLSPAHGCIMTQPTSQWAAPVATVKADGYVRISAPCRCIASDNSGNLRS